MSTIKSSDEHLTLNADGSSKDIKFQANGVEKASISSAGAFTSTSIDATKLTGDLPAISGANLTGVGVSGITSAADATAIKIDSSERVAIGNTDAGNYNSTADNLVVYDASNHAGITIANGGANKVGAIYFADGTSGTAEYEGYIEYNHNNDSLNFGTNHASRMLIDSNGHVTMPAQPAFLVNARQSAPNIAVNANTTAQFTEEVFDVNADYNTSTYTFTAPVTGKYQLNCSLLWINWDASANYYYLKIVTSNRTYYELFNAGERSSDVTYAYGHIHVLADMDANDTAYIELYQNSGDQQTNYENQSVFGGYLAC